MPAARGQAVDGLLAEEDLPDMNALRAKAESGRAAAQTQLADYYAAASDFTNAVVWYRRAAEQGHVPAKLTLAACLMTGRGSPKNPSEAARLLRQAADGIEADALASPIPAPATATVTNAVPPAATRAIVITRQGLVTSTNGMADAAQTMPSPSPSAATPTNLTRVERAGGLLAVDPVLQEVPAVFRPHPDAR